MDFPLLDVLDEGLCEAWLEKYFHAGQLKCPKCGAPRQTAWIEGQTKRSKLTKYRCRYCRRVYTSYVGTVFAGKHTRPSQTILLLRGFAKGESTAGLAREVGMKFDNVLKIRRAIQANAQKVQSTDALIDDVTETDEVFQNAGEKR
jgi:transposase-like protein